jgi:hypothetical protein
MTTTQSQIPLKIIFDSVSSSDPEQVPASYYTPTEENLQIIQVYISLKGRETGSTEVFDYSNVPEAIIDFSLRLEGLDEPYREVRTFHHAMNNL